MKTNDIESLFTQCIKILYANNSWFWYKLFNWKITINWKPETQINKEVKTFVWTNNRDTKGYFSCKKGKLSSIQYLIKEEGRWRKSC